MPFRVREAAKPSTTTNPSKRHRERLNGELETVATLLPFDQTVISRLDKLSVLRLAVSYLQIKAHFQVCLHRPPYAPSIPFTFSQSYSAIQHPVINPQFNAIPTAIDPILGQPLIDPIEHDFASMALKALGGFILILNENGEIYYASENIETYLGFHQSDILHQSLFEMIHSEDREDIRQQLAWNYCAPLNFTCLQDLLNCGGVPYLERNVNARFRCLLDNTCGFLRIDVRGKLMSLHGLPQSYVLSRPDARNCNGVVLGLVAICSPFVPPNVIDQSVDDPILKTKHALDFTLISMDSRVKLMLEIDDKCLPLSFYNLVHIDDAICIAEAHKEVTKNSASGILIYRLISVQQSRVYWMQSSCRMFYKNGKAESIGMTHRLLTEVEGAMLLEKRASLKAKLLSFDDSLLQSSRNLQSTAALPPTSGSVPLSIYMFGTTKNSVNRLSSHANPIQGQTSIQQQQIKRNKLPHVPAAHNQRQTVAGATRGRKKKKLTGTHQTQSTQPVIPTSASNKKQKLQKSAAKFDPNSREQPSAGTTAVAPSQMVMGEYSTGMAYSNTNNPAIHRFFPFSQDFGNFHGLSAYLSSESMVSSSVTKNDPTGAHWSSCRNGYWPTPSDLYYQNYAIGSQNQSSTLASAFYPTQIDPSTLVPTAGYGVEYPTLVANSANDLCGIDISQHSNMVVNPEIPLQMPKSGGSFESHGTGTVTEMCSRSENLEYKNFVNCTSEHNQQQQQVQQVQHELQPVSTSFSTISSSGFNLISEVTNTLLG